jgi:hypothetical protein
MIGEKGREGTPRKKVTDEDSKRNPNDVRDIRSIRMLERVELNFESPKLRKAMEVLGVSLEECKKK